MGLFRKKKTETTVRSDEVATLSNSNAMSKDINQDGIPDYLQREDIASLVKSNKDLNQWEVDVEKEIEEWIMGLRGYQFDAHENMFVPVSPPTLNDTGAKQIQTHIRSIMNKHAINTALNEEDVHQIIENSSKTLARWLKHKTKIWQVNKSDLDSIVWQFDNMTYLVLRRAIGDRQRKHISERTRLTGSTGQPQQSNFPG